MPLMIGGMGYMKRATEKIVVLFGLLFVLSIPLAMMGIVPELAMFALMVAGVTAAIGRVMMSPEESK